MTVDKDTKHQERLDLTQIKIQFLGGVSMPHIAFNYAKTKKKKKKKKKKKHAFSSYRKQKFQHKH